MNRIVHRRKHPVMVVNAENIRRLMDCVWHDAIGHNKMKGHQGKTPSSAIEFRRLLNRTYPGYGILLMARYFTYGIMVFNLKYRSYVTNLMSRI